VQSCAEVQRCRVGGAGAGKKEQLLYKGAKEVQRWRRDAVAVQRFITGDYAAEGAE